MKMHLIMLLGFTLMSPLVFAQAGPVGPKTSGPTDSPPTENKPPVDLPYKPTTVAKPKDEGADKPLPPVEYKAPEPVYDIPYMASKSPDPLGAMDPEW